MSLTVNTNMQALRIQGTLNSSTNKMNTAMERMASGSKINSAKDDAAGYAVANTLSAAKAAADLGADNVAMGQDLLSAADGTLSVISENLGRIMDLLEQASNGTYSSDDVTAIGNEITARVTQVNSLLGETFNGIDLFNDADVSIQIGTESGQSISLTAGLAAIADLTISAPTSASAAISAMASLQTVIDDVTAQATAIGALQNRLTAASDALNVKSTNLSSAISTIKDADIAEESASYVQSQILQQASASLLVQANSAPQIALTLIKG